MRSSSRARAWQARSTFSAQLAVGELQREEPLADSARHLVDRQPVGGDRVPQAEEPDVRSRVLRRVVALAASHPVHQHDQPVAEPAEGPLDAQDRVEPLGPVSPIGRAREALQIDLALRLLGQDDPLIHHQPGDDPHRERPAAEPEAIDVRARLVVPAQERVELDDVALEAPAERAPEQRQRPERRGADPVVVDRDLVGLGEVERLEQPPDVAAPDPGRGVPGPVGQEDDPLAHGRPRSRMGRTSSPRSPHRPRAVLFCSATGKIRATGDPRSARSYFSCRGDGFGVTPRRPSTSRRRTIDAQQQGSGPGTSATSPPKRSENRSVAGQCPVDCAPCTVDCAGRSRRHPRAGAAMPRPSLRDWQELQEEGPAGALSAPPRRSPRRTRRRARRARPRRSGPPRACGARAARAGSPPAPRASPRRSTRRAGR